MLQSWNVLVVRVNHSRYELFARQASGWVRNDDVRGCRLWLAKTVETFHGRFCVLFWLKHNILENCFILVMLYCSFVSVLFRLRGHFKVYRTVSVLVVSELVAPYARSKNSLKMHDKLRWVSLAYPGGGEARGFNPHWIFKKLYCVFAKYTLQALLLCSLNPNFYTGKR